MERPRAHLVSAFRVAIDKAADACHHRCGEDPRVFIKPRHKTAQQQMRREMEAVGLKWQKTERTLPQQHLMFFTKK